MADITNPQPPTSPTGNDDASPPPPEPTKHELALARRRERAAEKREEARRAAEERRLWGPTLEEIQGLDEDEDPNAPVYCICRKPDNGRSMVPCQDEQCEIVWFHVDCVGEEALETGECIVVFVLLGITC